MTGTWVMLIVFLVLLVLNVPVAFALGCAALLGLLASGDYEALEAAYLVGHRMATGVDKFALLAIPFFILAGLLMGHGGVARRLIDFAAALVGRFPGGLAYINVLTCMLFGAISGSAAAAVSSIGGFMMPIMHERGYKREFNASVTISAATTGLLIPPSNVMIVYSLATGGTVSIAAIFIAGIVPGILVGLGLMAVAAFLCVRRGYGSGEVVSWGVTIRRMFSALPAMLLIVIVLGGILGGIFTATEASAIAVVYAFLLSVVIYREIRWRDVPMVLVQSAVTTAVVLLLVGTSLAMSHVLTLNNVPQQLSDALLGITDNRIALLLLINFVLLLVGTFMDMTPAVLIFTPILLPVTESLGLTPLHFGVILIMNLCIGVCTPPVGTCLFLGCGIAGTSVARTTAHLMPFYAAMIAVLLLCTFVPAFTTWLPAVLDLTR